MGAMTATPRASEAARRSLAAAVEHLPLHDTQDFANADRGLIATSEERQMFLDGPARDTTQPGLGVAERLVINTAAFGLAGPPCRRSGGYFSARWLGRPGRV
jgi:hypothetical protein